MKDFVSNYVRPEAKAVFLFDSRGAAYSDLESAKRDYLKNKTAITAEAFQVGPLPANLLYLLDRRALYGNNMFILLIAYCSTSGT